jgi:hypothetical protein
VYTSTTSKREGGTCADQNLTLVQVTCLLLLVLLLLLLLLKNVYFSVFIHMNVHTPSWKKVDSILGSTLFFGLLEINIFCFPCVFCVCRCLLNLISRGSTHRTRWCIPRCFTGGLVKVVLVSIVRNAVVPPTREYRSSPWNI